MDEEELKKEEQAPKNKYEQKFEEAQASLEEMRKTLEYAMGDSASDFEYHFLRFQQSQLDIQEYNLMLLQDLIKTQNNQAEMLLQDLTATNELNKSMQEALVLLQGGKIEEGKEEEPPKKNTSQYL